MSKYKLWNCKYSFEVPSDRPPGIHTENYIVAARDEAEAALKGHTCLSNNPAYISLKLGPNDVKYSVKWLDGKRIKLPTLSLDEDDFEVSAKLSKSGETLEFVVRKK